MATLKHIRKRIKSVKNTQKITRAMKMVAAAKLRRAQQAMLAARPYSRELNRLLATIVAKQGADATVSSFAPREIVKRTAVLAFSSDRGLCGGFNSNIVKAVLAVSAEEQKKGSEIDMIVYGRKGRDVLTAKGQSLAQVETDIGKWTLADIKSRLQVLVTRYEQGELDRICVIYNRFVSAISQEVMVKQLLPFDRSAFEKTGEADLEHDYEPTKGECIAILMQKSLLSSLYLAYLESVASELGARMSAMDSATNNASEMIRKLTLKYNRARQAAITLELMDIVNGSESLA